jgi:nucleoside-diphosphate-sugar epimerase
LQQNWRVAATSRDAEKRNALARENVEAVDPADASALESTLRDVDAVLVTTPPTPDGCPAFEALARALASSKPKWIGYVSTTGVYGDRGGKWIDEGAELNAPTIDGARRVAAEHAWLAFGHANAVPVCVFRLPAIYGPGRSPFERLRDGTARLVRKPGQVFNRIHVDDAVAAFEASLRRPRAGRVYNVSDDEPAGADVYVAEAARLMGMAAPPEVDWTDASVSEGMRRFYNDNKRVSNARAKAELGWRPRYASWRDGLAAVLAAEKA